MRHGKVEEVIEMVQVGNHRVIKWLSCSGSTKLRLVRFFEFLVYFQHIYEFSEVEDRNTT